MTEDVISVMHRRSATTSSTASAAAANPAQQAPDRAARYFVVDGVEALSKFGEEAWDRVVCVMTTGQEWQFRPYKWSDPKQLFHHGPPPSPLLRPSKLTPLRSQSRGSSSSGPTTRPTQRSGAGT